MGWYRKTLVKCLKLTEWQSIELDDKEYAKITIRKINCIIDRKRNQNCTIVELGCGLGDIIENIHSKGVRIGIDLNEKNIMVAKLLHPRSQVKYVHGSFEKIYGMKIDFLIMVNVLHVIPPEVLITELDSTIRNNTISYIVMDEVRDETNQYKYEYDGEKLFGKFHYQKQYMGRRVEAAYKAYRRVVVYKKI